MTTSAELRRLLVPPTHRVSRLAADAYAAAAAADCSMQLALDTIEPVRTEARSAQDAYALANGYDAAIFKVIGSPLLPMVQAMRDGYRLAVVEQADRLVREASAGNRAATDRTDKTDATTVWLRIFGGAVGELQFAVCAGMLEHAEQLGVPESWTRPLRAAVEDCWKHESWPAIMPSLERLIEQDFWDDAERAGLLTTSSQIQLYWFDDRRRAREHAATAVSLAPDSPSAIEALAAVDLLEGDTEHAEDLVRPALRDNPASAILHSSFADCAWYAGDVETAEGRVLEGLQQAPYSARLVLKMLELYCTPTLFDQRQGRIPLLTEQIVAVEPESTYRTSILVARGHADSGQSAAAERILNSAVEIDPTRPEAHYELATLFQRTGDHQRSRVELDRLLALRPRSSEAAEVLAQLSEADDPEQALEWSRRAVDWTIGNPAMQLAMLASRQSTAGDLAAALTTAEQALDAAAPRDSRITDALLDLLAKAWTAGLQTDVRALCTKSAPGDDDASRAAWHGLVGAVSLAAGDAVAAIEEFAEASRLQPTTTSFLAQRADALRSLGRWDEAIAVADAVEEVDGDHEARARMVARIHNERGNAAYEQTRYDDAASAYAEASALQPDEPVFHGNLAYALVASPPPGRRTESLEAALAALTEAQRLDPTGDYGVRRTSLEGRLGRVRRFGELIEDPVPTLPILVEFADDLIPLVDPAAGSDVLQSTIPAMRASLKDLLGFDFPGVRMRGAALAPGEYWIHLDGAARAAGTAYAGRDCVLADRQQLLDAGIDPAALVNTVDPVTGAHCAWAPPAVLDDIDLGALQRLSAVEMIFRHLADQLRRHAGQFLTLDVALAWIRAHRQPDDSPRPRGDQLRQREQRDLALARALRACVQDQLTLDTQLLDLLQAAVEDASQSGETNPMAWAAAAVESLGPVRASLRSSARPVGEHHTTPDWVEAVVSAGRRLTATEEHEFLREAQVWLELSRVVRVNTSHSYLTRLLSDRFATVPGFELLRAPDDALGAIPVASDAAAEGLLTT